MTVFFLLLIVAAVAAWLLRPPTHRQSIGEDEAVDDVDALEAAEREVRDLDVHATPEDAKEDIPDWGPGAPR